jgi:hemerythrin-like domain-containing protein
VSPPTETLAHDHRELNELILAVRAALGRVERGDSRLEDELHELRDGIEAFREALLEHFAREQEGLLPFVLTRLPAEAARVDELIAEHDRIADLLTRLVKDLDALDSSGSIGPFRAAFEGFEGLYAAHSKKELAFLAEVAGLLAADEAGTTTLRALLEEP